MSAIRSVKVKLGSKEFLSCRQECFSGKQTTRKVHTKLHPGLEWRSFHILTSEDISDTVVCKILFLPLENKIHIFAPPCNILYESVQLFMNSPILIPKLV